MLTYLIKNSKITGCISMKKYITTSLETHLFFGRIMKEHALFLQTGFPAGEMAYINKANWYRTAFEIVLWQTVRLADGMVGKDVLCSGEVANSHFLRTAGPHFPDSQGHIKRTVRGNSRAGVSRPC